MPQWRYWLVDLPARATEVGYVWYRLYLLILFAIAAIIGPAVVLTSLVQWFVFGIRWGW
jgi:hypothetical protein